MKLGIEIDNENINISLIHDDNNIENYKIEIDNCNSEVLRDILELIETCLDEEIPIHLSIKGRDYIIGGKE